jgi:predicted nucleic acid-binding protein
MYLIDTNVISELRKAKTGRANKNVVTWAASVPVKSLFLSVVTILELEMGILSLERRDAKQGALLRAWLNKYILPVFSDRILNIDTAIAQCCAKLHVPDPQSDRDALISATALLHKMTVVTRNVADFIPTKVKLFNPWESY